MRNDLNNTQVITRRAFNALDQLCDVEPVGCAFAWLLLLLSVAAHAIRYCKGGECESDDEDEPSTMYS